MDGRAIVIAAKLAGIPILCIQHGVIGCPGRVDNEHDIDDIEPTGEVSAPFCPIPDKMGLYGEIYKRKCIDISKYPEEILEVTGSPRYDILAHAYEIYNREDILNNLSSVSGCRIDREKKMILLLTQPLASIKERELIIRYTLRAIKKIGSVQLIIKLHPAELDSLYKRIFKEEGMVDVSIIKNFDTYELLYICDLALSAFSTTQLEAIALDKPTISINVFDKPYWSLLDGNKAIMSVSDETSLYEAINALLFDSVTLKEIKEEMEIFKRNHLYKIDGLAYKRITNLIYNLIET